MPEDPEVTVRLRFYIPGLDEPPWEEEAVAWFAARPELKQPLQRQEGLLLITCGDSEVDFGDQMTWMIPSFCFNAVTELLDSGNSRVSLFAYDLVCTLRVDGEEVEIAADTFDTARFPRRPLLEALLACGERFAPLARALWSDDVDAPVVLPLLENGATETRAKLAAAFAKA